MHMDGMRRPAAGVAATVIAVAMIVFAVRALPAGSASAGATPAQTRACATHCGWLAGLSDGRIAASLSVVGSFGSLRCTPAGSFRAVRPAGTPACTAGLQVDGNRLVDGAGNLVRLRGVDHAGTEYMCSQGNGIFDGPSGAAEFRPMVRWGIDSVFIGLNEDCWLGLNGVKSAFAGQNYIDAIRADVRAAENAGIYPVLGFFWGDPGSEIPNGTDPNGGGQPPLPDNDHAPLFFEELATTFKDDPSVVFRLQEEPHPESADSTLNAWRCWSQGDVQYAPTSDHLTWGVPPTPVATVAHCAEKGTDGATPYRTVGMQSLINIIRGTGAHNVIQVPGLAYANMLSCLPTGSPLSCGFLDSTDRVAVHDTLTRAQLMADVDVYADGGQVCSSVSCYATGYGPVAAVMPLDAGEVGPNGSVDTNTTAFLNWMDGRDASYYAWTWNTWGALISSDNGIPDAPWGSDFERRLMGSGAPHVLQPRGGITLAAQAAPCTNPPTSTIVFGHPIKAGDDLFLVTGGGGYTGPASTVTEVSDNVNGRWSRLVNTGSRLGGGEESLSYAVYELRRSQASPNGLTITIAGRWGQSGMSSLVLDAAGVAGVAAASFDAAIQPQSTTFTSPATTLSAPGQVVLGLYANYSHASDAVSPPPGWHAVDAATVNTANCAGAAIDWSQPAPGASVAATITDSTAEYHYGGTIALDP